MNSFHPFPAIIIQQLLQALIREKNQNQKLQMTLHVNFSLHDLSGLEFSVIWSGRCLRHPLQSPPLSGNPWGCLHSSHQLNQVRNVSHKPAQDRNPDLATVQGNELKSWDCITIAFLATLAPFRCLYIPTYLVV